MSKALNKTELTLYNIAIVKSYAYGEEYDSNSGRTQEKSGSKYLREGYVDGFLAGFAHRMSGGHEG